MGDEERRKGTIEGNKQISKKKAVATRKVRGNAMGRTLLPSFIN